MWEQICGYVFRKENMFVRFCNGVCVYVLRPHHRAASIIDSIVCVCMFIECIYVYLHVYGVYVCACLYVHLCICMGIYVCASMYMHLCMCVYSRVDGFMV